METMQPSLGTRNAGPRSPAQTLGARPNPSHTAARKEVTNLLRQLKLPLDERGRRRAANRSQWFSQVDKPLEVHDILDA